MLRVRSPTNILCTAKCVMCPFLLVLKMPWPTDPRFASYFLPGYPAAIAAVMAAMRTSASPVCSPGNTNPATGEYSPGGGLVNPGGGGGFLSGLASSGTSPAGVAPPPPSSAFYTPPWEQQQQQQQHQTAAGTTGSAFGSPPGANTGYAAAAGSTTSGGCEDSGQAFVSHAFLSQS